MPSSRPDTVAAPRRPHPAPGPGLTPRPGGITAAALALAAALAVALTLVVAGPAGAQTDPAPPTTAAPTAAAPTTAVPTTVPPLRTPTTLAGAPLENCAPGNIVRLPDCGREPQSAGDRGGWLQVSLFFLVCGVVLLIMGFVWWRSRVARRERQAAGKDPVTMARASGQGVRRSTRKEPVAETSSN